jgi:hypothetical protein
MLALKQRVHDGHAIFGFRVESGDAVGQRAAFEGVVETALESAVEYRVVSVGRQRKAVAEIMDVQFAGVVVVGELEVAAAQRLAVRLAEIGRQDLAGQGRIAGIPVDVEPAGVLAAGAEFEDILPPRVP